MEKQPLVGQQNKPPYDGAGMPPAYGTTTQQPMVIYQPVIIQQESTPTHLVLFIAGFLFTPVWLIGACTSATTDSEKKWRRFNRISAGICMSFLLLIILLAFAEPPGPPGDFHGGPPNHGGPEHHRSP